MPVSIRPASHFLYRTDRKDHFFDRVLNFSLLASKTAEDIGETSLFHCNFENISKNSLSQPSSELWRKEDVTTSCFLKKALNTLNLVGDVLGRPTVHEYNAVLYKCLKLNDACAGEVVEVYHEMKKLGPNPNAITFNILLNGLLKLKELEDALFIAEEMYNTGFRISFSCLMKLFNKSLRSSSLLHSFNVMELMLRFDYIPTEPSANQLIYALCGVGKVLEAYFVFSLLMDKGFLPTVYSYNPILLGFCKSGRTSFALAFFTSLLKKGLTPNLYSFTALVYGFSREGLYIEACRVLNKMEAEGCRPNCIAFTMVIKFLCDDGKVEDALQVLHTMEGGGFSADLVTYNVILHALCCEGKILDATDILGIMDEKGFLPDCFTYSAVVGGLLKAGYVRPANRFSLEYLAKGYGMDVVACNIFIHALSREIGSSKALSIVKGMIQEGFVPSNVTYNTILSGFCKEMKLSGQVDTT